jgi:hypothetical protein
MSQTEFSKFYGCSQGLISRYVKSGQIPQAALVKDGRHTRIICDLAVQSLRESINPAMRKKDGPKDQGKQQPKPGKVAAAAFFETLGIDLQSLPDRTDLERAKVAVETRILQLKHDRESGALVDAEQVEKELFSFARRYRDAVQSIPDRCSPLVAAESDQFKCKQILRVEIDQILRNLADEIERKGREDNGIK